jgi:hypothetical protein
MPCDGLLLLPELAIKDTVGKENVRDRQSAVRCWTVVPCRGDACDALVAQIQEPGHPKAAKCFAATELRTRVPLFISSRCGAMLRKLQWLAARMREVASLTSDLRLPSNNS